VGDWINLKADDGHELAAYRDGPESSTRCLVIGQEMFGVNGHIRYVCKQFAAQGFAVIAPALLDRAQRGIELGYGPDDFKTGFALRAQIAESGTVADIEAAAAAFGTSNVGIIGYCWGGRVAWWGATRSTRFRASVAWYGGGIAADRNEVPRCPVQMHFGEKDHSISMDDVDAIRSVQHGVEIFIYKDAAHGFGCEDRPSFDPEHCEVAQSRTLDFFARHLN
jgi:carboxymethylenebutenolidase